MNAPFLTSCQTRPAMMEDIPAALELFNAFSRSQVGVNDLTPNEVTLAWKEPGFNLEADSHALIAPSGQWIGYADLLYVANQHIRFFGWAAVHPDYFGQGIGGLLVDWLVDHARQYVDQAPPDARVVLQMIALSHNQQAAELFGSHGLLPIRQSYRMRIDFHQPPEVPILPAGFTIRSIRDEADERAALYAAYESFIDHWGHLDEPFESYYQRRKFFMENGDHYDPSLWFIALDGEEVAGVSLCRSEIDEDPDMAWVGTLGVRRPWRKRGLGQALLQHSFVEFYRRGKPRAGLGVDASSLTGATRLYEKAGMSVYRQETFYELDLRPGKDYMTQSL